MGLRDKIVDALKMAGVVDVSVVLLENGPNIIFRDTAGHFTKLTENELAELLK